jgi:hypothetical protein
MECPREEEVLSAFVDDEAPAERQRLLARHVMGCEKCAAETGRLLAVRRYLCVQPAPASLSPDFWGRLGHALRLNDQVAHAAPRPQRRWQPRLALAGAAAMLLIVVALGVSSHAPAPTMVAEAPDIMAPSLSASWPSSTPYLSSPMPSLQPAAFSTGPVMNDGLWTPPAEFAPPVRRAARPEASVGVTHAVLPEQPLGGEPVERGIGGREYYAAQRGSMTLVSWRQADGWHLLTAEAPLSSLILYAELQGASAGR